MIHKETINIRADQGKIEKLIKYNLIVQLYPKNRTFINKNLNK